ncbi:MAG: hypothetical protein AABZ55_14045 [Bdellovibrionota bacterium]
MKSQLRGIIQILFLGAVVFLFLRFFPIIARFGEAAALGLREFWWLILVLSLGAWLIWVLRKRNPG